MRYLNYKKNFMLNNVVEHYKGKLKSSLDDIDPQAVGIIKKLKDAGFDGYIVGGAVRDLLVNIKPKDFDIATNATPQEVRRKVPYCFVIGRRFKLVHARRGEKIFEIATYRREATQEELSSEDGADLTFVEENFFGTLQEDAFRRDFTVNALFYDPLAENLVDHCGGLKDIRDQVIRMIGNPTERIKEDPIRILRALRLSQKLGFQIETELRQSIIENADLLTRGVLPRRREEWLKFFKLPSIEMSLMEMYDLQIFKHVLPAFHELFENETERENFLAYIRRASLLNFDLSQPTVIFAFVIYSFLLAKYEFPQKINLNEVFDNTRFLLFCKEELGVYKVEMTAIQIALQHIHVLQRQDSFLKKGERRQRALINNPHFDLALKLGLLSGELSAQDKIFWTEFIEKMRD